MAARRSIAALGAVGALALALVLSLVAVGRSPLGAPAAAPTAAPPPGGVVGAPGERHHARGDAPPAGLGAVRLRLTPALARAYAAAGALMDGRVHDLAGLDATALAELGHAEELLAYATVRPGQRQATRLGDGSTLQLGAPGALPAGAGAGAGNGAITGARARREDSGAAAAAAPAAAQAADGAGALPDAAVAGSLAARDRLPIPISGETTKRITLPDAWLSIPYQPALVQGQPLVIENRSTGEYAISLQGGDFGEVRLDGGLVVPGRYYRINGAATITSTMPVGVHIRPLTAVGAYYDQPLILPSADG